MACCSNLDSNLLSGFFRMRGLQKKDQAIFVVRLVDIFAKILKKLIKIVFRIVSTYAQA